MNLVNNIKALCEVKKLSISDLETKLNFSRSSISKWDKSQPTISRVLQVADLFDVSVDFLCKSEFYKEKDLTILFIDTLIKKTSEETIQWTFLNSQDSEHDKIRYTNELYDHFNIEYYEDYEGQIDKYDRVNIYYITSDKNIVYFIDQTIYFCTGGDVDQIDEEYYYIALKDIDDKQGNYIIREPSKKELEKLYKEIKNSYYEKPKQKKFDNFIKDFISL